MKFIKYTYIDAVTGKPCTEEPMRNGGKMPEGVTYHFALESKYPTQTPEFYGTTDLNDLPDYMEEVTAEEFEAIKEQELEDRKEIQAKRVRAERDELMAKTDWYIIRQVEAGIEVPQDVLDYRQALRDIPLQEGFPYQVEFPELP